MKTNISQKYTTTGEFVKQFILVSSGKVLALGSLFVGSIFLARTLGTEQFGYYSSALAIILLFDATIGAPLDNATIRFASHHVEPKRINAIQSLIFWMKVSIGFFIGGIAFIFADELSRLIFQREQANSLILATVFSGVLLLVIRSGSNHLQINLQFKEYARVDTIQAIIRLAFIFLMILLGITDPALYLLGIGSSALIVFALFLSRAFPFFTRIEQRDLRTITSYIGITSLIVVIGSISGRADVPILLILSDAEEAGLYSAAMQLAFLGSLLASYMAVIMQPRVVEMAKEGSIARLIRLNIGLAIVAGLLCIPIAIYVVPWLVPFIFGAAFADAAILLQILLIGFVADLIIIPILMPLGLQVIPAKIFLWELLTLMLFLGAIAAFDQISGITMAWIVTGVRYIKLIFYGASIYGYLRGQRS